MFNSTPENVRKLYDLSLLAAGLRHVRGEKELGVRAGSNAGDIRVLPAVRPEAAVYRPEVQLATVHGKCAELLGVSPDRELAGGDVLWLRAAPGEPQGRRGPAAAADCGRDARDHDPGDVDAEADGEGAVDEPGAAGEDGGAEAADRPGFFDNYG